MPDPGRDPLAHGQPGGTDTCFWLRHETARNYMKLKQSIITHAEETSQTLHETSHLAALWDCNELKLMARLRIR